MSYKTADRIYENSQTTGTGEYVLDGAVVGFQPFSVLGANSTCPYFATDDTNWEIGIGTVLSSPARLQRTAILASSNGGAAVNWGTGNKKIRCGLPAALAIPRIVTKSVAGGSNVTLTQSEQRADILVLTGALTANINVIVDDTPWAWIVKNGTSGAFTLTFKTASGSGVSVPQGSVRKVYSDGVNCAFADDVLPLASGSYSVAGNINFTGSNYYHRQTVSITSDTTITEAHVGKILQVSTSSGPVNLTLDQSIQSGGGFWVYHSTGNSEVTLTPTSPDLIFADNGNHGVASYTLNLRGRAFVYRATNWFVASNQTRVFGAATGGDKGTGSLNAVALYDNGNRVSWATEGSDITLSGASVDVTGIPSTARWIEVHVRAMSTTGASFPTLRVGTSGGVVTSGYVGSAMNVMAGGVFSVNLSSGFLLNNDDAAGSRNGVWRLTKHDSNVWTCNGIFGNDNDARVLLVAGRISLAGALDRVRVTTEGGTDTFDAGTMRVRYGT